MGKVEVRISDDYYKAYLTLRFDEEPITFEMVVEAIEERHIEYGLDLEVVKALIAMGEDVYDELIAEGKPHIHGIDSEILYTFEEEEDTHPSITQEGKVDFKNLNLLRKVAEGEVLATKTPATEGIEGMTVTGKPIRAKNGRDYKIPCGDNVLLDEEGMVATAACQGAYKMVNGKMVVMDFLEYNSDVGVETGNIDFKGDIVVNGNVIDEYTINCDGNLTINGIVEGAFLNVTGNLIVGKGITGHNQSVIHCDGDMTVQYIDNAEVYVKGNLEAGEILNSKVMCNGEVIVKGKKGHIIGGEITAKYAINATTIGSKLGVITLINLGVDLESLKEFRTLKAEIEEAKETERKLKMFSKVLKDKKNKNILTDEENDTLVRVLQTLEQTHYTIKDKTDRLNALRDMLIKAQKGEIKTETIYPDTLVKIGQSNYFIDEALLKSIIRKSNDEIVVIGF